MSEVFSPNIESTRPEHFADTARSFIDRYHDIILRAPKPMILRYPCNKNTAINYSLVEEFRSPSQEYHTTISLRSSRVVIVAHEHYFQRPLNVMNTRIAMRFRDPEQALKELKFSFYPADVRNWSKIAGHIKGQFTNPETGEFSQAHNTPEVIELADHWLNLMESECAVQQATPPLS